MSYKIFSFFFVYFLVVYECNAKDMEITLGSAKSTFLFNVGRAEPGQIVNLQVSLVNSYNTSVKLKFHGSCSCLASKIPGIMKANAKMPLTILLKAPSDIGKYSFDGILTCNLLPEDVVGEQETQLQFILDVFDGINIMPKSINMDDIPVNALTRRFRLGSVKITLMDPEIDPMTLNFLGSSGNLVAVGGKRDTRWRDEKAA